jgi:pseudouridine-5'-phosphate glycosidase
LDPIINGQSGFPYPDNVALASLLESVVRTNGSVPATVAVFNGVARVGLEPEEIIELTATAQKKTALKVSRRDLGYIAGLVIQFAAPAVQANC